MEYLSDCHIHLINKIQDTEYPTGLIKFEYKDRWLDTSTAREVIKSLHRVSEAIHANVPKKDCDMKHLKKLKQLITDIGRFASQKTMISVRRGRINTLLQQATEKYPKLKTIELIAQEFERESLASKKGK